MQQALTLTFENLRLALCAAGLSKCLDIGTAREVEVVAAKYELDSGAVAVIKRAWCSARGSYFYE